jgi:hypothetical protein
MINEIAKRFWPTRRWWHHSKMKQGPAQRFTWRDLQFIVGTDAIGAEPVRTYAQFPTNTMVVGLAVLITCPVAVSFPDLASTQNVTIVSPCSLAA